MARKFRGALSQYFEVGTALVTAAPLSMWCRFNSDDATTASTLISIADSTGANYFTLQATGSTAGRAYIETGGGVNASTTSSYQARKWHTALAVFATASTGAVYLDGAGKATFSGGLTQTGINKVDIGVLNSAGLFSPFSGFIEEAAIWNATLDDVDAARLAAGVPVTQVHIGNLAGYWRLGNDEHDTWAEPDLSGRSNHMFRKGGASWATDSGKPRYPFRTPLPNRIWGISSAVSPPLMGQMWN